MKKSFLKIFSVITIAIVLISCDKDFNSIGSDLVDDAHFDLEEYNVQNIVAYSKATGPVQSNNLPVNSLGIYKDPYFGTTKSHIVSQVELSNANPTIGENAVIDSVYLYIPYYSTLKSTSSTGERIYELDSVYGYSEAAKFKLHVYENGYFLRDFDPQEDFLNTQKYFTNEKFLVDAYKGTELLNNSAKVAQNEEFVISNKELYIYKTNGSGLYVDSEGEVLDNQTDVTLRVIKERKAPGIWLDLKNSFFQQKILDAAASGMLFNNNVFKDYFRGLLFEVEEIQADQGALAMLDLSLAEFKILFKSEIGGGEPLRRTLSLQMGYKSTGNKKSNTINFIEHTKSSSYINGLASSNEITGDEKLYIKGGNGSVAFLDVFGPDTDGNGVSDELDELRLHVLNDKWLINEANLVFNIDNVAMGLSSQIEPQRIYIFDATNNKPIIDYYADPSTNTDPKKSRQSFGGLIEIDSDKNGIKYKFRITEYIKRLLINEDENNNTNLRIGISVTETINMPENAFINPANPIVIGTGEVEFVPVASVMNPLGTVLYGTSPVTGNEDKKIKLKIYFTKPN
ncbi:DUF4270 domain-containing protein [Flavobacterium lacisediminis]|uniref:DUF4270 domain-containing protein n=1 Tax=Flavobacterium lacisediminis TaxID=2989705 RepID=A0ABT3EF40_9FLAO|nr:DUF4270 domain-containing protein [Flavobacterium lacisediminis]MCW1146735.1 DUF4270 domain-containing protein [Flavobacterium lacisediminis]